MTKSNNPMIRIHNASTDEIIDREMNDAELAQYKADQLAVAKSETEIAEKATDKAALLAQLGITGEQAALLLS